jgi:acetyltransferase-like isoleucine patch superfamily enzyme
MGKIQRLLSLNLFQFVYYNFFCKNVVRDRNCYILPVTGTKIELHKTAKIVLHANLSLNVNKYPRSGAECYLRLRKGAEMTVNGGVRLAYNATIEVHEGACFAIGQTFMNSGAVIVCAHKMTIGENCLLARHAMVFDSDHHRMYDDSGTITNYPMEVIIGDNVWLCMNSTVLKGSRIQSGSVVGANSLVNGEIGPRTLTANDTARAISKISWSTKGFNDDGFSDEGFNDEGFNSD